MTPEINQRIALLRQKQADGTITEDEVKEGVRILREGRLSQAYASESSKRKRAITAIPKAADMLNELDEIE